MEIDWQDVIDRLRTIASAGATYSTDPYDRARYAELTDVVESLVAGTIGPPPEAAGRYLRDEGYLTPKVDVRAVVFDDERLLLVQEASDRRWALPGGWADLGRSPAEVGVREVQEEAGLTVRPTKLLALYDKARHDPEPTLTSVYKAFFRCALVDGPEVAPAGTPHEVLDLGWFDRDEIPDLSTSRVTAHQISRMFDHLDDPTLPTDFDFPRDP